MSHADAVSIVRHKNDDLLVVDAARVSFGKASSRLEDGSLAKADIGLVNYLALHTHKSPFFHPQFCYLRKMSLGKFASWSIQSQENQFCRIEIEQDSNTITFFERGSLWAYLENGYDPALDPATHDGIQHSINAYIRATNKQVSDLKSAVALPCDLSEVDGLKPYHAAQLMTLTFRIELPIFIARQWFKHNIWFSRNEISRRYVDAKPRFHVPEVWRERALDKKQGSKDSAAPHGFPPITFYQKIKKKDVLISITAEQMTEYVTEAYLKAVDSDYYRVCPEQARMVLPQSMLTQFIDTSSLVGYARLYKLRKSPDAQKEIRDVAGLLADLIDAEYPNIWRKIA